MLYHTKKLFISLHSYGIQGELLEWLERLYPGRTHCTKVGDALSDETDMVSGVIQGSVIGPLMFLVFINEIIEILDSYGIKVKFFADDAKLYVKIVNSVDTAMLQAALFVCGPTSGNLLLLLISAVSCTLGRLIRLLLFT